MPQGIGGSNPPPIRHCKYLPSLLLSILFGHFYSQPVGGNQQFNKWQEAEF